MAVGYGDIYPTNKNERIVAVVVQLVGATSFGFILSAITTFLDSANPRDKEYQQHMAEIREWINGRDLPRPLRKKIRDHISYSLSKKSIFNEQDILSSVPTCLR